MATGKYQRWIEPDGLLLLEAWARDGFANEQIATKCGVSPSTLYAWIKTHSEISEALKRGKEVVDIEVENALLKRALGYEYDEVMVEESENGTKRRVTRKMVVPDTTAQIFWLKNRKPEQWRDKPVTDTADSETLDKAKEMLGGVPSAF